ncbi:unnamed protein product [Wuchereria bancrofti]|uniref:Uncharacterized protein n=2 Tax=Wuchereria bancrofti TaxID=6293 RepID=A0A3P7DWN6_WUCBA|nr:unnamed protein product [Wuchereria bancrofti]
MVVVMTVVVMCALRKSEEKNLTKASKIVSMPEVRKFKLDLSEKQQQEVDVDLDAQLDDIGCETLAAAAAAAEGTPEVISTDALQETKRKDEGYKEEAKKEESTQGSLKKHRKPRRSIHGQSGSKITKELQEKQWEQPTGENEVSFYVSCHISVNPAIQIDQNKPRTNPTQTEASKSIKI